MRYLATLAGLVLMAAQGLAIARWNGDPLQNNNPPARNVDMPDGIRNSVVRIRTSYAMNGVETLTLGSGVVLRAMRDEGGETGWLCVMTSAHETLFPEGARLRRHAIGFGNGGVRDFPLFSRQNRYYPFPRQGNENRVDLAILGIRVTDWDNQVPRVLTPPALGAEMRGDVIHAGYGATGRVDVENREYVITRDRSGRSEAERTSLTAWWTTQRASFAASASVSRTARLKATWTFGWTAKGTRSRQTRTP